MKKFLLKIGFAVVFFSVLIASQYFVLHDMSEELNARNIGNGQVFVWGDSQMFHGLDVLLLENYIEKRVLTSAHSGSGIYDFLVSEKNIPDNSTCVVSFSECALLRNPRTDYNRNGHELSCLQILLHAGCSMQECLRIEKLNRRAINYNAFNAKHKLIAYKDSIRISEKENIPFWHHFFEENKEWFSWKASSYKEGVQHLYDKHSQIILVQFPFDKQVESFVCNSINRHLTDSLKEVLIRDYALNYEEVVLVSDSLLMYDLSHMNKVGARLATTKISEILRADTVNNYIIKVMIQ